jgi:dephospho-CoA kinase
MFSMTEPLRLFLSGPAGSGKTEVARLLEEQHHFCRVSLGDLCRAECARRGWPQDRPHLQRAGDLLRAGDPSRLAALALAKARNLRGPLVIEGVRLGAEAGYLRARGVIGVAVEAPAEVRAARLLVRDGSSRVPQHRTEREAGTLPADLRLVNDGDRQAMERAVRLLVGRATLLHVQQSTAHRGGRAEPARRRLRETAGMER